MQQSKTYEILATIINSRPHTAAKMIRAMLLAAVALCLLSTACESPRPQRRSPGAGASILSHLSYLGVACHAPCGRDPLPPLRASAMSLQRPSPLASFPLPVSPAAPRDRHPGDCGDRRPGDRRSPGAAPCADPQGFPHRSCYQQHFQGRLHTLKQLTCTVLVRMSELRNCGCHCVDWQMDNAPTPPF